MQVQQTTKRGKYEDNKLEEVKSALHAFFNTTRAEPSNPPPQQRTGDPRTRTKQVKEETKKEEDKFTMFMSK